MYCSECKLRVADDNVTVCPVCQGPLEPEVENGAELVNDIAADRAEPEIKVGDKLSAYEKPGLDLDFNPEDMGLQSSKPVAPDAEEEDIMALTDLWEDEDIDADLEGVLAEAFSRDEVNEVVEMEDELDLGEEGLDLDKTDLFSTPPASPVTPARSSRSPLLILLLVVIGVGGASWFYFQNSGIKPGGQVVKPVAQTKVLKSSTKPVAKESSVVEKVKAEKPVVAALSRPVVSESPKPEPETPVRDLITAKAGAELNDKKDKLVSTFSQTVAGAPIAATPVPDVEPEVVVSGQSAVASSKKTEVEVAALENSGKVTISSGDLPENLSTVADKKEEPEPLEDTPPRDAEKIPVAGVSAKPTKARVNAGDPAIVPYAVHIGSFKSQKRVSRQMAMLNKKGFAAYSVEVDLKDKGVWQRVMVPGGATREEAKIVQKKLAELFPREESLIKKVAR